MGTSRINVPRTSLERQIKTSPGRQIGTSPRREIVTFPDGQIGSLGDDLGTLKGDVLGTFWRPIFAGWVILLNLATKVLPLGKSTLSDVANFIIA